MSARIIPCLLLVLTLISCNSNSENKDNLEERLSRLEQENRELKEKIENQNNEENTSQETRPEQERTPGLPQLYVFVVLNTEEKVLNDSDMDYSNPNRETYKTVNGYYVSTVKLANDASDEWKYKLMDNFQNQYSMFKGSFGKVTAREAYYFSSYEEASKAREKYLVQ